ncbi:hypothetical protein [Leucobacter salsicius]|uniref:hypothetical protein n=1 Tax=Leucobacter salsicius TaxID=664638 RepID=UPI00034B2EBF|nr:hypothetical protein [Leucobacter salsicius]
MTTPHPDPKQQSDPIKPSGPRTGPIIWGVIILAFCGYIAQRLFGGAGADGSWWIIATVIGLGVLLLGIGLTVVLRNHRR